MAPNNTNGKKTNRKNSKSEFKISALQLAVGGGAETLDDLIKGFYSLGFSDHEARAYLALLDSSPATAYEVAKVAGLPRANAYAVVKKLVEKGAAQPVSDKPVRYMPVDPAELLTTISESTSNLCSSLTSRLEKLGPRDGQDYVWIFRGRMNVIRKIAELIKDAEHHVWLKGTGDFITPFIPELQKAMERGVKVVIVLFSENPEKFNLGPDCKVYLHEGNGVIIGNADNFLTVTTDSKQAFITTTGRDPEAAYSENANFLYMLDLMFKHEIYLAEIMEHFGDLVEQKFGPGLQLLRERYSASPVRESFLAYVASRREELAKP